MQSEPTQQAGKAQSTVGRDTIIVRNVKKYFGPTRALDGVNFTARAGEIHAVVGGNGCGKSTLAKVVSGILPIDSGAVSILGEPPSTPAESRALGISTVYQEILVADEASVVDNIYMGIDPLFSRSISQERKERAAADVMQQLSGEAVDPHALVGTLPLGLKQWIVIARALAGNPRVLILDESSAALDFDSTERLFAKMRSLRDSGVTVLIVTHRIAELIRISDRATVLRDGRDVGVLEKHEITEKNLLRLMTGEEAGEAHAHEPPQPVDDTPVMKASGLAVWPEARTFDMTLRHGEIIGICGLDGQGQDAFVRVLSGILPAAQGQVTVIDRHGETHTIRSLADAVEQRVIYVSGDRKREGIFASLSIFENMVMPLYREKKRGGILGIIDFPTLGATFKREAENLMIKFGVREDLITSLSGGNQQKVLIGRGFAMRPGVIVLNDPARGIDVGAKSELYRHLRNFAAEGRTVVYLSSEIEEFLGFATRVIVFRDGAPFDSFEGCGLESRTVLEAMFGQTTGSGLDSNVFGLAPGANAEAANPPQAAVATNDTSILPLREPPSEVVATAPIRRQIRIVEFDDAGRPRERRTG
ncbi:MAG: sugar ABC transporter ATP-binding protein [Mesorhizobium sp.]